MDKELQPTRSHIVYISYRVTLQVITFQFKKIKYGVSKAFEANIFRGQNLDIDQLASTTVSNEDQQCRQKFPRGVNRANHTNLNILPFKFKQNWHILTALDEVCTKRHLALLLRSTFERFDI